MQIKVNLMIRSNKLINLELNLWQLRNLKEHTNGVKN
jgi:hypothetical protein